ncbi:hypothetical protein J6590_015423 [Homalodisca vitripennis]|nr:hypothetical protein J6590_015423 [Homalodisca vitripennis]
MSYSVNTNRERRAVVGRASRWARASIVPRLPVDRHTGMGDEQVDTRGPDRTVSTNRPLRTRTINHLPDKNNSGVLILHR